VVLAHWGFFGILLTAAELVIGIGLLLGIATRLAALGALVLIGPLWLMLLHTNTIEDLECQLDDVGGGGGHFEQVRLVKAVHESDTRMFTRGRVPRPNRRQTPSGNDRSPRAQ
jgi:hypothetical protein